MAQKQEEERKSRSNGSSSTRRLAIALPLVAGFAAAPRDFLVSFVAAPTRCNFFFRLLAVEGDLSRASTDDKLGLPDLQRFLLPLFSGGDRVRIVRVLRIVVSAERMPSFWLA